MKKAKFLLGMVLLLTTTIFASSCNKCQTCCYGGDCEELCQEDFDSKEQYKAYIKLIETFGGKCK